MKNFDLIKLMEETLIKHNENPKVAHWIFSNVYNLKDNLSIMEHCHLDATKCDECFYQLNSYINKKPLSKITNMTRFYGLDFVVYDTVFSPRVETELLADILIKILNHIDSELSVLDMCCGTGVIGITAKLKVDKINLVSVDINNDAIENTKQNAKKYNLKIKTIKSNLFNNLKENEKFDLIVCNPPYISYNDDIGEVKNYDPQNALFSDKDGLSIYEELIFSSKNYLKNKYLFLFEIGVNQEDKVINLLKLFDPNIQIKVISDYNKINRIIIGWIGYEIQELYL